MTSRFLFLGALASMALLSLPAVAGQTLSSTTYELAQGGPGGGRPPREAMEVCSSKAAGDACSFSAGDGNTINGTCTTPPQGRDTALMCVPAGAPSRG